MASIRKTVLSLFIATAFLSCAGSKPSAEKAEGPHLVKAGDPAADSLLSKLPEFARTTFKGSTDSAPGEYYYSATNDRIDSLFRKEDGKYELMAVIDYDSLGDANNCWLKNGIFYARIEDGKPIYSYKGNVSENEAGIPVLRSGVFRSYHPNGKIHVETHYASIDNIDHATIYYDDGKKQQEITGEITLNNGIYTTDHGAWETYFPNGVRQTSSNYESESKYDFKIWDDAGHLIKDIHFPTSFKEYWENGNLKIELSGNLSFDGQKYSIQKGSLKAYHENGKNQLDDIIESKTSFSKKIWNENGILTAEVNPQKMNEFWDNGKKKMECQGSITREKPESLDMDSARCNLYYEDGKIHLKKFIGKSFFISEEWNNDGLLIRKVDFYKDSASEYHEFWDNGNKKVEMTGILTIKTDSTGNSLFGIKKGTLKQFYENGEKNTVAIHESENEFSEKVWNDKGVLIHELNTSKGYTSFFDNGKTHVQMQGKFHFENGNLVPDSGSIKGYFENGKLWMKGNGLFFTNSDDSTSFIDVDYGNISYYYENGKPNFQRTTTEKKLYVDDWNKSGILAKKIRFHYDSTSEYHEFWDNGKKKKELTGLLKLANNDKRNVNLEGIRGDYKEYLENGAISFHSTFNGTTIETLETWAEEGYLERKADTKRGTDISYRKNGKVHIEFSGSFSIDGQTSECTYKDGVIKKYFESGKLEEEIVHKNQNMVSSKNWNEQGKLISEETYDSLGQIIRVKTWNDKGILTSELEFPNFMRGYSDSGILTTEFIGKLYQSEEEGILTETGSARLYYDDGKPKTDATYKDRKMTKLKQWSPQGDSLMIYDFDPLERIIAQKTWYKDSILIEEFVFPKYIRAYYNNGKLRLDQTGKYYHDKNGNIKMTSGYKKRYREKGSLMDEGTIKGETCIRYRFFREDGTLAQDASGTIDVSGDQYLIKDGILKEYDLSGKLESSTTYSDFQIISNQ